MIEFKLRPCAYKIYFRDHCIELVGFQLFSGSRWLV